MASRFLSVAIISIFVNLFNEKKVPLSHQIVMTYGGLRGAVAFYLALNLHSEYKDVLLTVTSALIMITVVGLGSTTNCVLKILNWMCPQDKILEIKEEQLIDQQVEYSDSEHSIGFFTQLEYYDENFGQKYFRKNGGIIHRDDLSEVELDEDDNDDVSSVISRREDMMENFFNRDVRGGDLSPYRKLSLRFQRKSTESHPNLHKHDKSVPIQSSKTLAKIDHDFESKRKDQLDNINKGRSTTPKNKKNNQNNAIDPL